MRTIVKDRKHHTHIIFMFFFFFHALYAYSQVEQDQLQKFENALLYGVDSSVLEILNTITELEFDNYEDLVLERMKDTSNHEIIVAGFTYFNTLHIYNPDIMHFAIEILKNYQHMPRQPIQYAVFYIKDNTQHLLEEEVTSILDLILEIIDTNNPAIALAALELIPAIYTEKDVAQLPGKDENTTPIQNTAVREKPLYSSQLKARYISSNIPNIQQKIILVIGQIQALNEIDFIINLIDTDTRNISVTHNVIRALSYFSNLSPELKEKIKQTYARTRKHSTPVIRVATIESLVTVYTRTQDEEFLKWIQDSVRDNEIIVRNAALGAFYEIFKEGQGIQFQKPLINAIIYIIENDPEYVVRSKAITTLSVFSDTYTRDYLIQQIAKITTLGVTEKTLITIAFDEPLASQGGIQALIDVVKSQKDKSHSSVLAHIASEMSKSPSNTIILPLLDVLMTYSDTNIILSCITTIKKHALQSFIPALKSIASDILYPIKVRNRAQQVSEYLHKEENS